MWFTFKLSPFRLKTLVLLYIQFDNLINGGEDTAPDINKSDRYCLLTPF